MTPYYLDRLITIYHGDCREVLPDIEVCDVVVTDPPWPLDHQLVVGNWTNEDEFMVDPFMGTGAFIVAVGIEVEERYCEVAASKLAQEVFEL